MLTIRNYIGYKKFINDTDFENLTKIRDDISQLEKEQFRIVTKIKNIPHEFIAMSDSNDFGDIRPYEVLNKCDLCGSYRRNQICKTNNL